MHQEKGFSTLFVLVVLLLFGVAVFFVFKFFNASQSLENFSPPKFLSQPQESNKQASDKTLLQTKVTYEGAYNGPLYDTSSKIGDSAPMDLHFENMDKNGVNYVIGYFFAEEPGDLVYTKDAIKKHPGRIIPFFSTGLGGKEAESSVGERLTKGFEYGFNLAKPELGNMPYQGIGEIETFQWNMPHNDPKVLQLFTFAKENNLKVMFHPLPGKISQVRDILEKYSETTFLIHMFQDDFARERTSIIDLMKTHKNLYYTIDIDHLLYDRSAGTGLLYKYEGKDVTAGKNGFVKDFDSKYQAMLKSDLTLYKPLIEAHPDRVTWGTEMNIRYTYEGEVYDRMIKFIRLFIGSLDKSVQEKIGYKNALEGFGEGITLP